MNPEKQKQNGDNPDLGFILDDKNATIEPKKKLDKKIILIIVLVIITLVVFVVSYIVSANNKVKKTNTEAKVQSEDYVLKQFISLGSAEKYDEIYSDLFDSSTPIDKQSFDEYGAPTFKQFSINNCSIKGEEDTQNETQKIATMECSLKDSDAKTNINFLIKYYDKAEKIVNYSFEVPPQ